MYAWAYIFDHSRSVHVIVDGLAAEPEPLPAISLERTVSPLVEPAYLDFGQSFADLYERSATAECVVVVK